MVKKQFSLILIFSLLLTPFFCVSHVTALDSNQLLLSENWEYPNSSLSSHGWYKEDYNFTGSAPGVISDEWALIGTHSLKVTSGGFLTNTFNNPEPKRDIYFNVTVHYTTLNASGTQVYSAPAFEMRSSSKSVICHAGLCSVDGGKTWAVDFWAFNMSAHSDRNPKLNYHVVTNYQVRPFETVNFVAEYCNHSVNGYTVKLWVNPTSTTDKPIAVINTSGKGFDFDYTFNTIYAGSVKSGTMNGDCPVYLDNLAVTYSFPLGNFVSATPAPLTSVPAATTKPDDNSDNGMLAFFGIEVFAIGLLVYGVKRDIYDAKKKWPR